MKLFYHLDRGVFVAELGSLLSVNEIRAKRGDRFKLTLYLIRDEAFIPPPLILKFGIKAKYSDADYVFFTESFLRKSECAEAFVQLDGVQIDGLIATMGEAPSKVLLAEIEFQEIDTITSTKTLHFIFEQDVIRDPPRGSGNDPSKENEPMTPAEKIAFDELAAKVASLASSFDQKIASVRNPNRQYLYNGNFEYSSWAHAVARHDMVTYQVIPNTPWIMESRFWAGEFNYSPRGVFSIRPSLAPGSSGRIGFFQEIDPKLLTGDGEAVCQLSFRAKSNLPRPLKVAMFGTTEYNDFSLAYCHHSVDLTENFQSFQLSFSQDFDNGVFTRAFVYFVLYSGSSSVASPGLWTRIDSFTSNDDDSGTLSWFGDALLGQFAQPQWESHVLEFKDIKIELGVRSYNEAEDDYHDAPFDPAYYPHVAPALSMPFPASLGLVSNRPCFMDSSGSLLPLQLGTPKDSFAEFKLSGKSDSR